MSLKRFFSFLLTVTLLLGVLSGCVRSADPPEQEATEQPTPATEETVPPTTAMPGDVVINEVMPENRKLYLGHENDWIELYNNEEFPVDLSGYFLTDDPDTPNSLPLEGLQIPAEGYLVITLDEDAPFRLSSSGESVYLLRQDEVISQLTFAEAQDGEAFDEGGSCQYPSPGFANTLEGHMEYLQTQALPDLIINEAISSNSKHLPVDGECYDIVELKNNSSQALQLKGYYLSDKYSELQRYALPDINLEPGAFMVIYCSGIPELGEDHTGFKISADGETLYLSKDGKITDTLTVPSQLQKNESYGRSGNLPVYFTEPTPGQENNEGFFEGLSAPMASLASGVYTEAVTLTLTGEGNIYYTLDGTNPTTYDHLYQEPITVNDITTVRCICVSEERISPIASYTYAINAVHDLPVLILSIPQSSLTGETGVLNHRKSTYEHMGTVTLIEDGEEKFSTPCGFRLHGNDSRNCSKQNFQLRFRSEYGAGRLEYPVFDELDIESFNSLLLKGGSEDCYRAVMRDEVATAMVADTNLWTQAMKPVVLYLGGDYRGVYYIRERYSDDYIASHLDVAEESVDLCYSTYAYRQNGDNQDFLDLRSYCKTHDMSTEENFQYIAARIDVVGLMDWYICRSFVGDNDLANIRRFRTDEADGLWHWMYFDLDWAFAFGGYALFSDLISDANGDKTLIRAVIASETGRDMFLKRCATLLNTVLNDENINAVVDSIVADIDSEMARDRARWNSSYEYWDSCVDEIREFDADGIRTRYFLRDLKSYFYLSDEEMTEYFGTLWETE